jgi:type II secretory pathway pseudopilin PulG
MIELLVVLVIIMVVAGLIVVGITSAMSGTRDRATQTRLDMLDGFMAAYQNADNARTGGMGNTEAKKLPEALKSIATGTALYSTIDNRAADPGPLSTAPADIGQPLTAPDPGAAAPYLGSDPTRYPTQPNEDNWVLEPAVARTQAVMRRLLTIPANQSTFSTVSDDAKTLNAATTYDGQPSLLSYASGSGPSGPLDPPLLVDGFGNVIIFVPPPGLSGLAFSDGSRNVTMRAANGRAFWVSAGADGLFAGSPGSDGIWGNADDVPGADDNVYSTEVIRQ